MNVNLQSGGGTINSGASSLIIGSALRQHRRIDQDGRGHATLTNANTYSGATTVSAGELVGATIGSCANSAVTVSSGATNGVQVFAANGGWTCGALTYSAGTTYADLNFNGMAPSTITAPLQVSGALTFNGTPTVILRNLGAVANGVYPLIKYGYFSGTPPTGFTATGFSGSISNDTVNKILDLVVTNANTLYWAVGGGNWDITTTANWKDVNGITGLKYYDGGTVTFDDTATGSSPILVTNTTTVSPTSVTANLTNKNYTISGSAIAGNTALTKNGTGTLTLTNANTFTGGATVNAGTLVLAGTNTLVGIANVNAGATLQLQANAANTSGGNSSAYNWTNSYARLNGGATLQLRSDSSVTFNNTNVYAPDVAGSTTNTIDVNAVTSATGNTLSLWPAGVVTYNNVFNVTGGNGYSLNISGGFNGSNGYLTFNPTTADVIVGPITNLNGGLNMNGTGTLTINGLCTFGNNNVGQNNVNVNTGTMAISSSGELYNTGYIYGPTVTVANGATLQMYAWGYAYVGSLGALDFGAGRLLVNGGTITYTGVGENTGGNNNRLFTVGTNGATLNAAGSGTWFLEPGGYGAQTIGTNNTLTLTGSGNGRYDNALVKGGSVLKTGSGTWTLAGTNNYTGSTTISNGILALGANNTLPTNTTVDLAGGTLAMSTYNNTVNALQTNGSVRAMGTWGASGSTANHISSSMTGTGVLTVTTGGASTSVVTSSANPSTYGNLVFTDTVTGSGGDGSAPNGTVTFYDGATAIGTGTLVSSSGTVSYYTLTLNSLTAAMHSITASYAGNVSYDVSTSGVLSQQVNQATLTITAGNTNKVYGNTVTLAGFTTSGLTNSDTVTGVTLTSGGAASTATVGSYAIAVTNAFGSGLGNYTISYVAGTLAVTPLPVVLNGTRAYDGTTNAAAANLFVTNTANGDLLTVTNGPGGLASANVGTNAITSFGSLSLDNGAGTNYTLTGASGAMIITNTPLTITANNDRKVYGNLGSSYGAGLTNFTSSGLENGETIGTVTITTSDTPPGTGATDPVGNYDLTPSAATGGTFNPTNYLITYNNGTLTVVQASTSVGASSSENPSGYKDAVAFIASLPADATGSVVFSSTNGAFSTNPVSGVTTASLSITNLPRGTNLITVAYLGDGNYVGSTNTLNQIVTNHPPVAVAATYYRSKDTTLKIIIANLLATVTDVDGDAIILQSLGTSGMGATILSDSTYVYYVPAASANNNANDSFTYTVSDGFGGSATANINVYVYSAAGLAQMRLPTNGMVNITFFGIPNYTYIVQTTTNLSVPWWTLSTNTAGTNGTWLFTDPNATNAEQYYRISQP